MKLSDFVADFLAKKGISHAFVLTGGASAHLIDSVARHPKIKHVCCQHEQANAFAADAFSRVTGNFGVAISTSGPGATNLLTGVCSAYYDSVPVIYITGQVSTFRSKKGTNVRQVGFQETDIVPIFKPVTNYAVYVEDAKRIRYELEKACYLAKAGRPGPVLVDIPDNLQRVEIDPDKLEGFVVPKKSINEKVIDKKIDACVELFSKSKRPVIIFGWGVRLAQAAKEAQEIINKHGIPFLPTWAVADLLPWSHPYAVGTFGTHGTRYANFAIQNADFVLSVGSRLDTKATGSPITSFARHAKKIVVDIDMAELEKFKKFGLNMDLLIHCDAKVFLEKLSKKMKNIKKKKDIIPWINQIKVWKKKYPICLADYYKDKKLNPYVFVEALSNACKKNTIVIADTGCCLAWMMQAFKFKANQRLFHDWNNTAMGWAIAASIGASFAKNKSKIVCITGDGSLQMNIQELGTIIRHKLPIKIFLINNKGYSMIRQTQDQWLNSYYVASSVEGGLPDLDFSKIAKAYGFYTIDMSKNKDAKKYIDKALKKKGPVFCNVYIENTHRVVPQVKYGRPNEDAEPLLDRKEFLENMIIDPLAQCK